MPTSLATWNFEVINMFMIDSDTTQVLKLSFLLASGLTGGYVLQCYRNAAVLIRGLVNNKYDGLS